MTLNATKTGIATLLVFADTVNMTKFSAVGSGVSYFAKGAGKTPSVVETVSITQKALLFTFPACSQVSVTSKKLSVMASLSGLKGPEIGLPNLADLRQSLNNKGYSQPVVHSLISSAVLDRAVFVGTAMEDKKFIPNKDLPTETSAQYHGATDYLNLTSSPIYVGEKLEVYIPSQEEINALDMNALSFNLPNGHWPIALRPARNRSVVDAFRNLFDLYHNNTDLYLDLFGHDSINGVAGTADVYNFIQMVKAIVVHGLYYVLTTLGMTLVPIQAYDPLVHRLGDNTAPRIFDPLRDVNAADIFQVNLDSGEAEKCAQLRQLFYRQTRAKALPVPGQTPADAMIPITEPEMIATTLAVLLNIIAPTTPNADQSYVGGLTKQAIAQDIAVGGKGRPDSLVNKVKDFEKGLLNTVLYDLNSMSGTPSSMKFGVVVGRRGEFLRNIAMTENRTKQYSPKSNTENGRLCDEQTIYISRGLAAIMERTNVHNSRIVGTAIKTTVPWRQGSVYLDTSGCTNYIPSAS